jgi:hypothetical protein
MALKPEKENTYMGMGGRGKENGKITGKMASENIKTSRVTSLKGTGWME